MVVTVSGMVIEKVAFCYV